MTTESFICSGNKTWYSWLFSTFLFSNPTYNQITLYHSGLRQKNILFRLLQCLLNSPTSPPLCFPLLFIPSQQPGHTFKYRSDHDTSLFKIFQNFHFWVRQWHTDSLQYLKNSCIYIILFHKFRLKKHTYLLSYNFSGLCLDTDYTGFLFQVSPDWNPNADKVMVSSGVGCVSILPQVIGRTHL